MDKDQVRRKARYAATKLASAQWGKADVLQVTLNMVTAWEDPQGISRWEILLPSGTKDIEVSLADFSAKEI
jgi:hypothetical protein